MRLQILECERISEDSEILMCPQVTHFCPFPLRPIPELYVLPCHIGINRCGTAVEQHDSATTVSKRLGKDLEPCWWRRRFVMRLSPSPPQWIYIVPSNVRLEVALMVLRGIFSPGWCIACRGPCSEPPAALLTRAPLHGLSNG